MNDDFFHWFLVFSLSDNPKRSVGLEIEKIATKPEVTGSNSRHGKLFLKQRSKRASKLLWPKSRFF